MGAIIWSSSSVLNTAWAAAGAAAGGAVSGAAETPAVGASPSSAAEMPASVAANSGLLASRASNAALNLLRMGMVRLPQGWVVLEPGKGARPTAAVWKR
ncbi:hypothetical protein D3C85_1630520 [compost metagenome]